MPLSGNILIFFLLNIENVVPELIKERNDFSYDIYAETGFMTIVVIVVVSMFIVCETSFVFTDLSANQRAFF